jgi:hypothetical protein
MHRLGVYHVADKREYRLKIDGFTPETMPMRGLLEYLSDIATLFGEDGHVHLIKIEQSSVSPVVLVDWEAEPKVLERLIKARNREGSEEAVRAIDNINARLRSDNTTAHLLNPAKANVIEFPGVKIPKAIEWPSINQAGTFFGVPIAVGGKNDPVPVHLQDGAIEHHLSASRGKAKDIAQHLFSSVIRATGHGRWRKMENGDWQVERFIIEDFEPVKVSDFDEAVSKLKSIDAAWKRADDPLAELEAIRNGDSDH